MINGFDWIRYWVFFENGVDMGQLDTDDLVRPAHWDQFFVDKANAAEAATRAAEAAEVATDSDASADTAAAGDDPAAALRALIPAHILERSEAAKARLTA